MLQVLVLCVFWCCAALCFLVWFSVLCVLVLSVTPPKARAAGPVASDLGSLLASQSAAAP